MSILATVGPLLKSLQPLALTLVVVIVIVVLLVVVTAVLGLGVSRHPKLARRKSPRLLWTKHKSGSTGKCLVVF